MYIEIAIMGNSRKVMSARKTGLQCVERTRSDEEFSVEQGLEQIYLDVDRGFVPCVQEVVIGIRCHLGREARS